ncbi:DNA polymerase-3 subunit epsilon [Georgenia satyanarayanai]|uniref:DNA polymerase-3 subunit epsilon n=1 Tax=Georgenia satyanarayanai TaxID=860221 RepID=A0A2Y9C4R5_9MICO|nr:exonuclease domain-containing protein [Georgenia satyanarayanai]PYG00654.1 DNA polymerase-3 subunit epsilon [Georgenia satyanarayanai]SSA40043.1 DNA polymerase-3 subunit epsilon [Georgenia satyanarayanai]
MDGWTDGPLLGFDTETTGVDVREDRIVTAALVLRGPAASRQRTWLIDPGVEIPTVASDIHGITTDHARAEGMVARVALEEIAAEIAGAFRTGIPVVAYNASFDLTLLDHELARWQLPTLAARLGRAPGPVLDPLVLDRALDRSREGARKLVDLCQHYRVEALARLHTAEVDVAATLEVLDCLVRAFPELSARSLAELHTWQRECHREWAAELSSWRTEQGLTGPGPEPEWLPALTPAP